MDVERYFLIPFYEYMKTIIGLTALQLKNGNCNDKHFEFNGNFTTEFNLNYDNNLLLTESRKHKSNKFDVRLIMWFCKMEENPLSKKQNSMIDCFPRNLKIFINGQPIQLSYLPYDRSRRPGRMNPRVLDITNLIFDNNNCTHTCNIQWVQDDIEERFNFALFLVRQRSFDELSSVLMKHRMFSVQSTINLLMERIIIHPVNNKSNIEYMFQDRKVLNTSLICPISLNRIKIPVRGRNCTHLKCFDLLSFLIINFVKPIWVCPICDKKAFFCLLKIDGLIYSIINDKRSNLMDEIKFNENGQWKSYDEVTNENSETDNFYDIPEMYYSLKINNEQVNDKSKIQRRPETVLRTELNKDFKNILPISDWMSLKNEFISSNVTNMIASRENNTTSNGANSKCSPFQTLVSKKSAISISSQTNVPLNSKTRVFQENKHQTNLMPNPNNDTNSNNSKRTHEHSVSESVNEKEPPVKKPTSDSRIIPKVNVSKTVDERVRNDESHNKDSEMADNLINNYNQSKSNTIIHVVNKEDYVYKQIESQLFKEIWQYNNYWFYRTTGIPNNFKFSDSPKRTMYITTIISCYTANLLDIFPDIKKQHTTSNMRIHAINKAFTLFLSGKFRPIHLEKHTTLEIINGDGSEKCITFDFKKSSTIVMVEILYPVKPRVVFSNNEPLWTYNINLNDFNNLKSFIRLPLTQQQEDKLTYFVSANYVTLRDSLNPAVIAVTVLNFEGELLVNSIITPRNSIKHYQSHVHGLKEEQVRNNWDSEDFKIEIMKILDARIIVGLIVKDFLEAIDFPLSRVLGIRDLASAKCLENSNLEKSKGIFRIKYLERQILPDEKPLQFDLQSEKDARTIRKIYLQIRDKWEDHILPDKQSEVISSTLNKRSLPADENPSAQKAIKITSSENESGNLSTKHACSYPMLIASQMKVGHIINHKFMYIAMNDYFSKIYSETNQTFWHFNKCTFIPNNIKIPNSPERELLAIMVKQKVHENLSNLLPNSFQQMDSRHMVIHSVNAPLVVFIPSRFEPIELSIQNSLVIKDGGGREKNIVIHINKFDAIIVIELYKREIEFTINNEVYEDWVYNLSYTDFKSHLSFTRKRIIECEEEHDKILFISAKYVAIKGENLSFPVSISIENYEGRILVNSIITPREPVKHYQSHSHGLKEADIIGRWDEHLCKIKLHKLLDGKILVGFVVFEFLESIKFPFNRILGIRDLSNGKCFEKMGLTKAHGAYRLDYLLKYLCPDFTSINSNIRTEVEVRKINILYHFIENQWEDHIYPVTDENKQKNVEINQNISNINLNSLQDNNKC